MASLCSCQRAVDAHPFPGMRQRGGKDSNPHRPGWNRVSSPLNDHRSRVRIACATRTDYQKSRIDFWVRPRGRIRYAHVNVDSCSLPSSCFLTLRITSDGEAERRSGQQLFGACVGGFAQVRRRRLSKRVKIRLTTGADMFRQRHAYTRRVFRQSLRRWMRGNIKAIAAFLIAAVGVIAFMRFTVQSPFLRGLLDGLAISGLVCSLTVAFLLTSGAIYQLGGGWGEDNTKDQLRIARKRGLLWGAVPNVEVSGADIDHLVLAPAGAFALETKWHFSELDVKALDRDVHSAVKHAATARSVLRSADIGMAMDVTPVVVVWGRGQRELPTAGIEHQGVAVVAGADLPQWMERCRHGRLGEDHAEALLAKLESFADSRRGKQPLPEPRPIGSGLRLRGRS